MRNLLFGASSCFVLRVVVRQLRSIVCAWVVLIAGCGGRDDEAAPSARCESLRDHLVELRLAQATNVDKAAHRVAMLKALGDTFVADCQTKLGASEVDCALNATDTAAAAACKPPTE